MKGWMKHQVTWPDKIAKCLIWFFFLLIGYVFFHSMVFLLIMHSPVSSQPYHSFLYDKYPNLSPTLKSALPESVINIPSFLYLQFSPTTVSYMIIYHPFPYLQLSSTTLSYIIISQPFPYLQLSSRYVRWWIFLVTTLWYWNVLKTVDLYFCCRRERASRSRRRMTTWSSAGCVKMAGSCCAVTCALRHTTPTVWTHQSRGCRMGNGIVPGARWVDRLFLYLYTRLF